MFIGVGFCFCFWLLLVISHSYHSAISHTPITPLITPLPLRYHSATTPLPLRYHSPPVPCPTVTAPPPIKSPTWGNGSSFPTVSSPLSSGVALIADSSNTSFPLVPTATRVPSGESTAEATDGFLDRKALPVARTSRDAVTVRVRREGSTWRSLTVPSDPPETSTELEAE